MIRTLLMFDSFVIESPLAVDLCAERISNAIYRPRFFNTFPGNEDKSLIGKVSGHRFWARLPVSYRNSFLPYCYGFILPTGAGASTVRVRMTMAPMVWLLVLAWAGMFIATGIAASQPMMFGMGVAPYLMALFGYYSEVESTRRALIHLLESEKP